MTCSTPTTNVTVWYGARSDNEPVAGVSVSGGAITVMPMSEGPPTSR